ncbi:nucleoside diphosphate-linked moiety X motif 17 [Dermochelys coriacea]|uniref:nucleoside diphosphate-linked moiety X motif 17 n=1 Tax=Dermochelys coriacea TaxID=27794 RepID=UPI001CA99483|nr:nucleoside diphosphate-linked moiety X motif 17 [Dermochelys coriacea]
MCPIPAGNAGRGIPDDPAAAEPVARRAASRGRPSPLAARRAPLCGLRLPGSPRSRRVPEPGPRSRGAAPMESLARGLVRLVKGSARPERAGFLQSITGHFCAPHEDEVTVSCGLDQNEFVISDSEFPGSTRILLKPAVQVSCIQGHKHWTSALGMRDPSRNSASTASSDLGFSAETTSACPLDLTVVLSRLRGPSPSPLPGPARSPIGHQLRRLQAPESSEPCSRHSEACVGFQTRIKADGSEVSAYAWLEPHVLECIAAVEDGAENMGHVPGHLPPTIKATELSGGSAQPTELPTATFLNTAPAAGEDVEQVSTGTRFALRLWLDTLAVRDK